jgi:HAMP domain-containing protein
LRAKIETLFSISSQLRPIRPMRDVTSQLKLMDSARQIPSCG